MRHGEPDLSIICQRSVGMDNVDEIKDNLTTLHLNKRYDRWDFVACHSRDYYE